MTRDERLKLGELYHTVQQLQHIAALGFQLARQLEAYLLINTRFKFKGLTGKNITTLADDITDRCNELEDYNMPLRKLAVMPGKGKRK